MAKERKGERAPAKGNSTPALDETIVQETEDTDVIEESAPTPRAAPANLARAGGERVYKGTQELDHDLFKLDVARMKKNVSFTEIPIWNYSEHVHIFHTIDSSGKKQTECAPVGGHFHAVEVTMSPDGVPSLKVSKPMIWVLVRDRKTGKKVKTAVLMTDEDPDSDDHTHEVIYLGSEKIRLRKTNLEFAKFHAQIMAVQNPSIPGISGG